MENIVTAFTANGRTAAWLLALAAALAVAACAGIRLGYKQQLAALCYRFVCSAENQITGTRMGRERKAQVLAWLHDCIPFPITLFITETDIDRMIEGAVQQMKEALLAAADGTGQAPDAARPGEAEGK